MTCISQALLEARLRGLERLDTHLLLLHAIGRPGSDRAWLLSHDTDTLDAYVQATFMACVARRAEGEPLAYITGHKEFFGLDLLVNQHVLIPRPDTETLVEWALETLVATRDATVVDLGTGSGAIALALKSVQPDLRVTATDISAEAVALARNNAQRLQLELQFQQRSWLDELPTGYQTIVSNPPYITEGDKHLEALKHEPLSALTSGTDGLNDIRHIIAQAAAHLIPGGWLLLEHGHQQAASVRGLMMKAGLTEVQSRRDLSGIERCSGARLQPDS